MTVAGVLLACFACATGSGAPPALCIVWPCTATISLTPLLWTLQLEGLQHWQRHKAETLQIVARS